jgi:NRPS condensation-like uncharacterized protein
MRSKAEKSVTSVPLNCVDACLLALDSINEPMLFWVVVDLEGEIDPTRLKEAVASAQQAHPVMKTIVRTRNLRLCREMQEDSEKEVLTFADQTQLGNGDAESYLSSWMNQPLNPGKEFPVRVLLLRKSDLQSSLMFTFHHSAADGLRGVLFARKVVESYNGGLSRDPESTADVRVNRKGDELLEFARSRRSEVKHYYRNIISSLFGRFVIAALPPPTRVFHDRSGRSRELAFCLKTIGPEELRQVQSKARTVGVGLNDVLLAASYLAVEKWNTMHGKASDRIRVMVPVNISPANFRYLVSNHVSWLSFETTRKDRLDSVKLVRKARADTTNAISNGIPFSLIYFFYVCSRFPLFLMREMARFLMITRMYVDSILITNVGFVWSKAGSREPAVSSMGNARVLNVSGLAPVVTPMGVSVVACTYSRNLNLSLTYRPALLSEEMARRFLGLYVEEIKNYQVGAPDA